MRILLTVHQFLPEYSAGTEILTFHTAKCLQAMGHEVAVFTGYPAQNQPAPGERYDSYVHAGIPVERYHHSYLPLDGQSTTEMEYNNLFFARHFRSYLRKFKPDLVHFFHLGRLSASAVDVCERLKIPMVLTPTDFWFICPTNQLRLPDNSMCAGPRRDAMNCVRHLVELNQSPAAHAKLRKMPDWLLATAIGALKMGFFKSRWFAPHVRALARRPVFMKDRLKKIDRVMVPTRLMENILLSHGLDKAKSVFAPYGIELPERQAASKATSPVLRIGFIGTLYEHKGPHILLQALKLLPQSVPVAVKIYGNMSEFPAYVEELKKMATDDSRIEFCGTFPNTQIGEIFSQLDVLVVPSLWYENTPLVIYHAQAFHCPVIASNLGGMAEPIVHEQNGLLFPAGSSAELAGTLKKLSEDKNLLQHLKENARPPRSIEDYARQAEQIYEVVLQDHTVNPSRYWQQAG